MDATVLVRCPACGTMNRIPQVELDAGRRPVCGRCKSPLTRDATPVAVTDATFARQVEQSPLPVLVDMWAAWCGPCQLLEPVIEELAAELAGRMRVVKLNVDDNPATAGRFAVRSIPTLIAFKGGREVDRIVGVRPKAEIARRLEQLIG